MSGTTKVSRPLPSLPDPAVDRHPTLRSLGLEGTAQTPVSPNALPLPQTTSDYRGKENTGRSRE